VAGTCRNLLALAALLAPAAHSEPLLSRNQNPLLMPYGLPEPLPARLPAAGTGYVSAGVNWSNSASLDSSASHDFTLDGESRELRLRLAHSIGGNWAAMASVPWRHLSGGSLDGLIEDWHEIFGLPDGSRRRLPEDELLIAYVEGDETLLHLDDSISGPADPTVGIGHQLAAGERHAVAAWLTVKLPVGESRELLGSGATDVALSVAARTQMAAAWELFGQVDAALLGQGDILSAHQEDHVLAGLVGISWNAWRGLDLTVQVNANSRVFDLPIDGLSGEAIVLGYGGSYRTRGGWRIDVGMNEDIDVETSPDATFHLTVQHAF
jgi:hypothetical protein